MSSGTGLQPRYHALLMRCLGDDGKSVRKKAVDLLGALIRDGRLRVGVPPLSDAAAPPTSHAALAAAVALPPPGSPAVATLWALLQRVHDHGEDDSVRDAVVVMFIDLWFAPAAAGSSGRSSAGGRKGKPVTGLTSTTPSIDSAAVAAAHERSGMLLALAEHALSAPEGITPLVDMLQLLLPVDGDDDGREANGAGGTRPAGKRAAAAGDAAARRLALAAIVQRVLQVLVLLAARKEALLSWAAGDAADAARHVAATALYGREIATIATLLHILALTDASLLAPHLTRVAFLLKGDRAVAGPEADARLRTAAAGVLEVSLPLAGSFRRDSIAVAAAQADLIGLLAESDEPAVMSAAAAALGVLLSSTTRDQRPLVRVCTPPFGQRAQKSATACARARPRPRRTHAGGGHPTRPSATHGGSNQGGRCGRWR